MAIAVLDDVMLREPRLLVPGMQPLGPVRLDANYDCISFAMFGRGGGSWITSSAPSGYHNRDLVNPGSVLTASNGFNLYVNYVESYGLSDVYPYLPWVRGALSPPYTVLVGWDFVEGIIAWSFLANGWTGVYAGNSGSSFTTTDGADFSGDFTVTPGSKLPSAKVNFGAISIAGNSSGIACSNGGPIATDTNFVAPSYTPVAFKVGVDSSGSNSAVTRVACFAVFKVAMSAAEIQALTRDPYAPLIPA